MEPADVRIDTYWNLHVRKLVERIERNHLVMPARVVGDARIIESMLLLVPPPLLWFTIDRSQAPGIWSPALDCTELFIATIQQYLVNDQPLCGFTLLTEMNGKPLSSKRYMQRRVEETTVHAHGISNHHEPELVQDLLTRIRLYYE